jgi:hypothetical protein
MIGENRFIPYGKCRSSESIPLESLILAYYFGARTAESRLIVLMRKTRLNVMEDIRSRHGARLQTTQSIAISSYVALGCE